MTSTLVTITHEFLDGRKPTLHEIVRLAVVDGRATLIETAVDWRVVRRVTIQAIRRPLLDVDGHVRDAEKAANEAEKADA